ncbi:MAG TPA: Clp protease N-terminal domain-containing protein [Acidimicrobiia bacterium]|jgi:hypothetical protein
MPSPPQLEDLIDVVEGRHPDGDPLAYLAEAVMLAVQLDEMGDQLVGYFVDLAREAGASWADVGQSLGVTKQAAQKRFVDTGRQPRRKGVFARFGAQARQVVVAAQEHAREAGSDMIGTGHILLGLIDDPKTTAARAIAEIGSVDEVRVAAGSALGPSGSRSRSHIPFAQDSKKVLQLSLREALRDGARQIGTEHILLGMLRDEASAGASVLTRSGVTRRKVEDWLADQAV